MHVLVILKLLTCSTPYPIPYFMPPHVFFINLIAMKSGNKLFLFRLFMKRYDNFSQN